MPFLLSVSHTFFLLFIITKQFVAYSSPKSSKSVSSIDENRNCNSSKSLNGPTRKNVLMCVSTRRRAVEVGKAGKNSFFGFLFR